MGYNQDAWRMVEEKVREEIANAINAAVAAHEAKEASATFANSHKVASAS